MIRQSGALASQDPDRATSLWNERNPCTPNQRSLVPWQDKPFALNVRMHITAHYSFPFTWGRGVAPCLKNKATVPKASLGASLYALHAYRRFPFVVLHAARSSAGAHLGWWAFSDKDGPLIGKLPSWPFFQHLQGFYFSARFLTLARPKHVISWYGKRVRFWCFGSVQ